MGCDIHGVLEAKTKTKRWIGVELLDLDRNYYYFGKLFNVRNYNDDIPIAGDRGIPSNASGTSKDSIEYYGSDGHSYSYITLKEIKRIIKSNWKGNTWEILVGRMEEISEELDKKRDVRLVVWFDN